MNKKMFILGVTVTLLGMVACKSASDTTNGSGNQHSDIHTSNNSLDWAGAYTGVIPCADCSGIQVNLNLADNGTYKISRRYLDKGDTTYDSSGKVVWSNNGNTITLGEGDDKMILSVGENTLTMLDRDGKNITGDLAHHYILTKVDKGLVERYWKLTELFGEPVTTAEGAPEAHMIMNLEDNRIHGNSGCNTFTGTYELKPLNRISFSKMASTLMMYLNMDTETKMLQVFETADNYILNGDTLVLNKARMAPLARFVAQK